MTAVIFLKDENIFDTYIIIYKDLFKGNITLHYRAKIRDVMSQMYR